MIVVVVPAVVITWSGESEPWEPLKSAVPRNCATTVWLPTDSAAVCSIAWPLVSRATGEPEFAPSITNCTEPVGTANDGAFADTVAVKVTFWPRMAGVVSEVTVVVVSAALTSWLADVASEAPKLVSPL